MIEIKLSTLPMLEACTQDCVEAYVFTVSQDADFSELQPVADLLYKPLQQAFEARNFKGSAGSYIILNTTYGDRPVYLIFLGLGARKEGFLEREVYRRALGRLVRLVESYKIKSLGFKLPDSHDFGLSARRIASETATLLHKASYHFDEFITDSSRKFDWLTTVVISSSEEEIKEVEQGVERGKILAESINLARYYCDLPPSILTPSVLAYKAQELAEKHDLKIQVFDESKVIALGMGGLEWVSKGSAEEARFVILEYNSSKKDAATIGIVGKGVTFDSGGLSLKPAQAMETMKDDMAGAAVVISTMLAVARLKPEVNIIAFAPLTENLPSGTALKPGDIITFYNGKTAEVKNTDAEGRLILADALSYAISNYKLDAIIDLATLTGACAHALGPFYAALLSQHKLLKEKVIQASKISGDRVWALPMDDDYKAAIRSDVADMANIGSGQYKSGTITAAFFLQNFVGSVPWVHLDTAGVAFGVPDLTYLRPGATGFGIRLLIDLFENWN